MCSNLCHHHYARLLKTCLPYIYIYIYIYLQDLFELNNANPHTHHTCYFKRTNWLKFKNHKKIGESSPPTSYPIPTRKSTIIIWNHIYLLLQMGHPKKQTKQKGEEKATNKKKKKDNELRVLSFWVLPLTI